MKRKNLSHLHVCTLWTGRKLSSFLVTRVPLFCISGSCSFWVVRDVSDLLFCHHAHRSHICTHLCSICCFSCWHYFSHYHCHDVSDVAFVLITRSPSSSLCKFPCKQTNFHPLSILLQCHIYYYFTQSVEYVHVTCYACLCCHDIYHVYHVCHDHHHYFFVLARM